MAELAATGKYLKRLEPQFQRALQRGPVDFDAEYLARLENQRLVKQLLVDLLDRYKLDALVYPFKSLGAPLIGMADGGSRDNPISSTTGLPAIVAPAGINEEGLPIAIEFLGRPFSEAKLIQLVHAYEQVSRQRVAPKSTPHLPGEVFTY